MANLVRKNNRRQLQQARTNTAKIEWYLEGLEKQYEENYKELANAMHVAREMNAQLDDLLQRIHDAI